MSAAGHQRLRPRATVVAVKDNEILLVKYRNEHLWALPGGRITPPEEPATRAVIAVAEATGLRMTDLQFVDEYAGRISANQVFIAKAEGSLQPNQRYIQDARWWDCEEELPLQDHVNGIMAFILERTGLEEPAGAFAVGNEVSDPYDGDEANREETDRELEGGELDLEEAGESTEESTDREASESGNRFAGVLAVILLAVWTGIKALMLALSVGGKGLAIVTDGLIAASLAWQGVRPKPVPRRAFPKGTREALYRQQGSRCVYCGRRLSLAPAMSHIDHITPLNQGGAHEMYNWQLLCPGCNTRKSDRNDLEFRSKYGALLSLRQGHMPDRTIRQSEFKKVAAQSTDAVSYSRFKAGKYYTPVQKLNVGGAVGGIVVGGGIFWGIYELFTPQDASGLLIFCVMLGVSTWAWVRFRAWTTGRNHEPD